MSIVYHVIHSRFTEPNRSAIIPTLYYKGTFLTVLLKPKFNYLLIQNTCCVFPLVPLVGVEPTMSFRTPHP